MIKWILCILWMPCFAFAQSEQQSLDSLQFNYYGADSDTQRIDLLIELSQAASLNNPKLLQQYANELLKLSGGDSLSHSYAWANYYLGDYYYYSTNENSKAEKNFLRAFRIFNQLENEKGIAESAGSLASLYFYNDRYKTALSYANIALNKFDAAKNLPRKADILSLICDIYSYMENYNEAIQYCVQSLRLKEQLSIDKGTEVTLNTIGLIYQGLGSYEKARDYLFSALLMAKRNNEPYNIATTYSNIGNYFLVTDDTDSALLHFKSAMTIDSISGDTIGLAYSYFDLAKVYRLNNDLSSAENYLSLAQRLAQMKKMPELEAKIGLDLGDLYLEKDAYQKSIVELKQSLVIAQRINSRSILQDCYQKLAKYYDVIGDEDNALVYMRLSVLESERNYRDQNAKDIAEIEALYNIDKKEKEIDLLKKEKDIKQLQADKRQFFLIALGIGTFFLSILIAILFNRNQLKNKVNRTLQIQNDSIQQQKTEIQAQKEELIKKGDVLEEKNKQITDSIIYARQIQESLLPSIQPLKSEFSKTFLYYRPKDIVSGDFCWAAKLDHQIAVAVVDCTGHGVPGAFMTVLANSLLNQIILETGISSPDLVVSLLDQKIQQSLNQQNLGTVTTDGLDIGLLFIHTEKKSLQFTGAKIPLYITRNGKLQVIKPDRYSVGSSQQEQKVYTKKEFKFEKEDMIYMSSDGYQDQFGGPKDKKFMKPNFHKLLDAIHHLSIEEQEQKLEQTFQLWKGDKAQTDDILVLGIKV